MLVILLYTIKMCKCYLKHYESLAQAAIIYICESHIDLYWKKTRKKKSKDSIKKLYATYFLDLLRLAVSPILILQLYCCNSIACHLVHDVPSKP